MVKLRGHHLICLHFYRGEGYDKGFVENLEAVLREAAREGVTVVGGGDDICVACPSYSGGVCIHEPGSEEKVNVLDTLAKSLLKIENRNFRWGDIKVQIPRIITEWREKACAECEWISVCEKTGYWNTI